MPKYYGPVRVTKPNANAPLRPLGIPPILPVQEPEGYPDAPYPGDLNAGNGAAKNENLTPKTSGYTNNVPHRDYPSGDGTIHAEPAEGDGKNGMAG